MSVAKDATGTIFIAIGIIGLSVGVGISATGIGAICGIPLALLSFIPFIWGMLMRSKAKRMREEIYLQEGLNRITQIHATSQQIIVCSICQQPNPNTNAVCINCRTSFVPK